MNAADNPLLTNPLKTPATSFPHRLARSLWHLETNTRTTGGTMFVVVRIMILIASAYAGSALADMQFAPLPDSALSSQP
ncbi:hypothetical protein [Bradyrhizobium sp. LTSP885]|uniref:hypothetical protein n=1 Tax=Bradyrhizobium sp. LTSP885 TaxID=1619232 RepID=UPI0012E079FB|nr:hypothetical protein [Bradyrhizobium sp. LTSP885]